MEITVAQIRAARALLDWTQDDLATNSGLSKASIQNYENGKTEPNSTSLNKIVKAFADNGIEFLDDGVRLYTKPFKIYEGQEEFMDFMWDVYNTVKDTGGEIVVSNVDERDFIKYQGDGAQAYMDAMATVKDLRFRILIEENDYNFVGSEYAKYKWVSSDEFGEIPFYIYGNKKADIVFADGTVKVFVTNNKDIATHYRRTFDSQWKRAKLPTKLKSGASS